VAGLSELHLQSIICLFLVEGPWEDRACIAYTPPPDNAGGAWCLGPRILARPVHYRGNFGSLKLEPCYSAKGALVDYPL
jgi:hypothetical protein